MKTTFEQDWGKWLGQWLPGRSLIEQEMEKLNRDTRGVCRKCGDDVLGGEVSLCGPCAK